MSQVADTARLATIALDVATEAATLVLTGFRRDRHVSLKGKRDLVTDFDLESEALIRDRLGRLTPDIAIVGEEQGGDANAERVWYCDPIDGTVNFAHGHPFFAVSIGLAEAGVPVAGAVVAPALGLAWHGSTPGTATRAGEATRVSQTATLGDAIVATGFPLDRSRAPQNNVDAFARVIDRVRAIRRCGSAALDLCLVADGTYDAYWERALGPWDAMGGAAIALAAGATITALDGGPADYSHGHLAASNGHIHRELLAALAE